MLLQQAPEWRETEVFTRMPQRYRRSGMRSDWADANRAGQATDSFIEGPVFDDAGNLYVADIPFGRIFRIDSDGGWEQVAEWAGEPNGMTFLSERELLITDYRNGLMVCDIVSGSVRTYLERRNTERFKGVNDLIFDGRGNLYFTDQGQTGLHDPTGRLYRLRPNGQLDLLLGNVPSPNGVALSPDGRVLYLAVTRGNAVWRVPLLDDGSVSKVSAFFTSYGPSGPDGLAVDEQGRLIVANPGAGVRLGPESPGRTRGRAAQHGRNVTHQRGLRRRRPEDAVLHGIGHRFDPARFPRRTGAAHPPHDAASGVRRMLLNPRTMTVPSPLSSRSRVSRTRIDWCAVERDYRTGEWSLRELAERHACSHSAIANRAGQEEWRRAIERVAGSCASRRPLNGPKKDDITWSQA